MPRSLQPDRKLFGVTLGLCLIGAVMVFSASAITAREAGGNGYTFLLRQLVWIALGLAGIVLLVEPGLPEVRPAACDFYGRFAYVGNVDFSFLFGPVACHASLVPAGATELATFGNCKAGFDFFSSMVFGDSPRAARFWSERSGAHTFPRPGNCFAHGGADSRRAGYGHRVHDFADRGGHAFCVRTFHALHRGGRACSDSRGVFINRPDALSIREIQSVPVAEF